VWSFAFLNAVNVASRRGQRPAAMRWPGCFLGLSLGWTAVGLKRHSLDAAGLAHADGLQAPGLTATDCASFSKAFVLQPQPSCEYTNFSSSWVGCTCEVPLPPKLRLADTGASDLPGAKEPDPMEIACPFAKCEGAHAAGKEVKCLRLEAFGFSKVEVADLGAEGAFRQVRGCSYLMAPGQSFVMPGMVESFRLVLDSQKEALGYDCGGDMGFLPSNTMSDLCRTALYRLEVSCDATFQSVLPAGCESLSPPYGFTMSSAIRDLCPLECNAADVSTLAQAVVQRRQRKQQEEAAARQRALEAVRHQAREEARRKDALQKVAQAAATAKVAQALAGSPAAAQALAAAPGAAEALASAPGAASALAGSPAAAQALAENPSILGAIANEPALATALANNPELSKALASDPALAAALAENPGLAKALAENPNSLAAVKAMASNPALSAAAKNSPSLASALAADPSKLAAAAANSAVSQALAADPALAAALAKNPEAVADLAQTLQQPGATVADALQKNPQLAAAVETAKKEQKVAAPVADAAAQGLSPGAVPPAALPPSALPPSALPAGAPSAAAAASPFAAPIPLVPRVVEAAADPKTEALQVGDLQATVQELEAQLQKARAGEVPPTAIAGAPAPAAFKDLQAKLLVESGLGQAPAPAAFKDLQAKLLMEGGLAQAPAPAPAFREFQARLLMEGGMAQAPSPAPAW